MPCVFPVLSLKIMGLVGRSDADRARARAQGLAYGAGVLVSFWALSGLLIALREGGRHSGWGFQLQSPVFLSALAAVLFALALNLLGVFEVGMAMTRLGQLNAGRGGLLGSFGTGVLATVVATPCTAPFMGAAVGFALSQPAGPALLIFTALGCGLALPYLLLLYVPALQRLLPRPGAWMETFKQLMAFPLFATVLWLVWVLGLQVGMEGIITLLAGLLLIGLGGWWLGRFAQRTFLAGVGWSLLLLGALLPALRVHALSLVAPAAAATVTGASAGAADDLPWEPFSPERVAQHRRAGRPVLVDFTAAWCVSCQVNERLVLRAAPVRARVQALGVATLKADWTNYDPVITQALAAFGRSGVPCYAVYPRDPQAQVVLLSEVLTQSALLTALEDASRGP